MQTKETGKQHNYEKDMKRLQRLRPMDDDFMRCIFKNNLPLAQKVLRIILDKPDLKLVKLETQADMKRLLGARSICLDALGEDDNGKMYDLEIQRDDKGADPHRARYHSSVMDVENLDASEAVDTLPDTYVIFITENDIYDEGLPVYPIERMNVLIDKPFADGEHILYVNGAYRGDDAIGKLMHDFSCADPDEMIDKDMAEVTRYYKESEKGVSNMCKIFDEIRGEGREEGRKEGRIDIALELIALGEDSYEKIAKVTKLSLEEVKQLAEGVPA